MRKLISIIIALVCFIFSSAAADHHTEIQVIFSGTLEGRIVSLDLYEQDSKTTAVSTVFPEIAVELDHNPYQLDLLLHSTPQIFIRTMETADHILSSWLDQLHEEEKTGQYAGFLFSSAFISHTYTFQLSELIRFLQFSDQNINIRECEDSGDQIRLFADMIASWTENIFSGTDPTVRCTCYDYGKYATILFMDQEDILLSVSADNSNDKQKHLVITHKENSTTYYHDLLYKQEGDRINVIASLYSSKSSTYISAVSGYPIYSETVTLSPVSDSETEFLYCLDSTYLSSPFELSGAFRLQNEYTELHAEAYIRNREEEKLRISIYEEDLNGKISFADKQIKQYNDKKENTEISLSVISGLTALAAELIPVLPVDYQKILLSAFFE